MASQVIQGRFRAGGLAIAATHADLGMPAARTLELGLSTPGKALE